MSSSLSSELAQEAYLTLPPKAFLDILASALPPSSSTAFEEAIQTHQDRPDLIQNLKFHSRQRSLRRALKELERNVRRKGGEGANDQKNFMLEIAKQIDSWLQALFFVCIELREELELGHDSLVVIRETLRDLKKSKSRHDFQRLSFTYKILLWSPSPANSGSSTAYSTSHLGDLLSKFWRDLLLVAAVGGKKNDQLGFRMVEYLETPGCDSEIQLAKFMRDDKSGARTYNDSPPFEDEWYPVDLKAGLPSLRTSLHQHRKNVFKSKPTVSLFRSLVAHEPSLSTSLQNRVRSIVESKDTPISSLTNELVTLAFQSYFVSPSTTLPSMVALVARLEDPSLAFKPWLFPVLFSVIVSLAQLSSEGRAAARPILERHYTSAVQAIWDEINKDYPNLAAATEALKTKYEQKKLSHAWPQKESNQDYRSELLDSYVKMAKGEKGDNSFPFGGGGFNMGLLTARLNENRKIHEIEGPVEGVVVETLLSDDSDYEEEKARRKPDLVKRLRDWRTVLEQWPDEEERKVLQKKFGPKKNPFYEFDGWAKALAQRLTYTYDHVYERIFVSKAIQALYATSSNSRAMKAADWNLDM